MQRNEVIQHLQSYIVNKVLDGKNIGLDETTPLLEWGIINSLEIVRLLGFIRKQFDIDIAIYQITAENFVNIGVIADMVISNERVGSMTAGD
ncbi:MAG TPA: acyl carrier protein [Ktedonobacteraceae bacterium]|nr:acyl carrier protein [Ktedonobacteraceae bacterium]